MNLKAEIAQFVLGVVTTLFPEAGPLAPKDLCASTSNPEHGDYQSNVPFRLAKTLRRSPREIAEQMVASMPSDGRFAWMKVAGNGFINFRLSDTFLGEQARKITLHPSLGVLRPEPCPKVILDYSSPNIAKRMHVGHLRSTVIGNALDRMFRFAGWEVVADNHLGDWGTPFGKLIVAWKLWGDQEAYEADPVGELQRLYKKFGAEAGPDENSPLLVQARVETAKLQRKDPENLRLWADFREASLREFDQIYRRLGVRFDVVLGESEYGETATALVEQLLAAGKARESNGGVVVPLDSAPDGEVWLIRKADGALLYATTDLQTAIERAKQNPDRVIYVTDMRQQEHFAQLFRACDRLGVLPAEKMVHVWFGMLRYADGTIASSRSGGKDLTLVDVLDEAVARARAVVEEKRPDLSEHQRASIAEAVGTAALKYADLSQNPTSDLLFDPDKSLALVGNTAAYALYARARCERVFSKASARGIQFLTPSLVLTTSSERDLALQIARFPETLDRAVQETSPKIVTDYVFALAQTYSQFYEQCEILTDDPDRTQARLTLTHGTSHALSTALRLLGIEPQNEM